jgi:hypothetical protein
MFSLRFMRKVLTRLYWLAVLLLLTLNCSNAQGQDTTGQHKVVDIVWLKDGSRLSGTILKWELARGMVLKLVTGAEVNIPKEQIAKVTQDVPYASYTPGYSGYDMREPKTYKFREEGLYNNFSFFLNFSENGGAGVHYSVGHRFSRMISVGMGIGYETNDFFYTRTIVPLYLEARGFFVPQRISPYYALKIGYGFALRNDLSGTIDASGGLHFCPELGVRFGGKHVNYYLGLEYKIQNATFTNFDTWGGGQFTDVISYRRTELRMGLLF